tara:strand:+ start:1436 stop:1939 length:504 start_codon:yes stop_codon:yes gene_type:complete
MTRLSLICASFSALALSGCAALDGGLVRHFSTQADDRLMVSYDATIDAVLPGEIVDVQQFLAAYADPGEPFALVFENLPAAVFDLAEIDNPVRLNLAVNIVPFELESGDIRYDVTLTTTPVGGGDPSVVATPQLTAVDGAIVTVHLAQEADPFHSRFNLDLNGSRQR